MATSTEERLQGGIATSQVEYQMRFREIISRAALQSDPKIKEQSLGPFLTISRETGSKGARLARLVGEKLDWAVLDKDLVDRLAHDLELEPRLLKLLDETRTNWFSETLLNLFNSRLVAQQGYVEGVGKVVALAAAAGPVIIVGRGAHLILPADKGLRVRVMAPRASRIATISQTEGLDLLAAQQRLETTDADRQAFVRRNFRCDITDISLYDLVINSDSFGEDGSVELIIRSLEIRELI